MKTYYVTHQDRRSLVNNISPSVLALGFFDGVHLGHQKVINTAVKLAKQKNVQAAVMTFTPHPREIISKEKVNYLTPMETKKEIFQELGVDVLYLVQFDARFASLSPQQFAQDYLIDFQVKHVVAGYDFTYGFRGEGTMNTIVSDGLAEYDATMIDQVHFQKEKISSTAIRSIICTGNIDILPNLLGDYYRTNGTIRAEGLFRQGSIVYKIDIHEQCLLPMPGTYEVIVQSEQKMFRANVQRYGTKNNVIYLTVDPEIGLKENGAITIKWLRCQSISKQVIV